jgi:predicted dehydrogenase
MGAAAAAMALAPHVRGQDEPKKLGFAIVGLGRFGAGQLLRSLPECKLARPVALVSGHPDKARALAQKYGIAEKNIYNYDNFDSIKDNPEVDVIYVVLPNSMHAEYTIRAANAGKHVMCEKPMAISVAECEAMIGACKKNERKLMIGYRLRYEPYNMKAIELCHAKTYGAVRVIESTHSFPIGQGEWRTDKKLSGGGPVMDVGIYSINAFRYLLGEEPTHVSAQVYQPKGDPRFENTEGSMSFLLKFPSGALCSATTSYMHHTLGYYRVASERAVMTMEPAFAYGGLKLHIRARDGESDAELPQVNQFAAEMDHFAECVRDNKQPRTPGEEGLADMKVITKLYESAESGKTAAM